MQDSSKDNTKYQMSPLDANLFSACIEGNINNVLVFLKKGASLEVFNKTTLPATLAKNDQWRVLEALTDAGADVNAVSPETGMTALMSACEEGNVATVDMLLKKKAVVDSISKGKYASGNNALMYASKNGHTKVVLLLLESGAKINSLSSTGATALMWAARNGHLSTVQALVEHGADVNLISSTNTTALRWARKYHRTPIIQFLLQHEAKELNLPIIKILQDKLGYSISRIMRKFLLLK